MVGNHFKLGRRILETHVTPFSDWTTFLNDELPTYLGRSLQPLMYVEILIIPTLRRYGKMAIWKLVSFFSQSKQICIALNT